MRVSTNSLLALALFAPALATQSIKGVSPKTAATAPRTNRGISGLGFGFNLDAHRFQQIYNWDSFTTGTSVPIPIRSVNFRKPLNRNIGNEGGQTIEIALDLSLAAKGVTADTATGVFENNLDAKTRKRVIRKKKINLPILGTPQKPSLGFDFKLPLDSAQIFLFNPNLKRALVMDIYNYSIKVGNWSYFVDGWTRARSGLIGPTEVTIVWGSLNKSSGFGSSANNGAGCKSSGNKNATHSTDPKTLALGELDHRFTGSVFVPSLPGVMSIGATKLNNVKLPGTSCSIANDLLILLPFVSGSTAMGTATLALRIPVDSRLVGPTFFTQMFWLDTKANSFGIVSSNGLANKIGTGFPLTGSLMRQRGLITEFTN